MAANLSAFFLGLFGHPVAHSYSPRIHKNFAAQFGLTMDYQVLWLQHHRAIEKTRV
jgi:shikimate 5-dehydrogenase